MDRMAWKSLRALSRLALARRAHVQVTGLDSIPAHGPLIIAARHYHHLFDGCALLTVVPRQIHFMVGLDWMGDGAAKNAMARACHSAHWPIVERADRASADPIERLRMLRSAYAGSMDLLRDHRILVVFPEGYPVIDPHPSPRDGSDILLPFEPGFARIAVAAARQGIKAPIVPAGLSYQAGKQWTITLRFGKPQHVTPGDSIVSVTQRAEDAVRQLSLCS